MVENRNEAHLSLLFCHQVCVVHAYTHREQRNISIDKSKSIDRQTKTISVFDTANQAQNKNIRNRINEMLVGAAVAVAVPVVVEEYVNYVQTVDMLKKKTMVAKTQMFKSANELCSGILETRWNTVKWPNKLEIHVFQNHRCGWEQIFPFCQLPFFFSLAVPRVFFCSFIFLSVYLCFWRQKVDNVTIIF